MGQITAHAYEGCDRDSSNRLCCIHEGELYVCGVSLFFHPVFFAVPFDMVVAYGMIFILSGKPMNVSQMRDAVASMGKYQGENALVRP
jgi:hypothetical protein